MNLFVILAAFLTIIAGKGHKNGHGDKHDNDHWNKHDNGHGNQHLPVPDAEDSEECDVEYVFSESATETERCSDGKIFFYTDRYKNETFCSNSATVDNGECWWDTSIGSNCLESTECVWLTNSVEQGMCYCSHSARCEACEHQTPAPTVNTATSQCPGKCEVYYLGCVGMYCKCLGECTSPEEAGCSEPINAGCHSYYFGEEEEGNREDGDHGTGTDEITEFIDDLIGSGIDDNDWLDDLFTGSSEDVDNNWLDDLVSGFGEDADNDWQWPWWGW